MIIDVYDMHIAEPVWRLRVNPELAKTDLDQDGVSRYIANLFDEYPPGLN